jgi:hypothetical protein
MNKIIFGCLLFISVVLFSGCHTVKNTAAATGIGTYMVGKGVVDDTKSVYDVVMGVDEWFQEKYW